MRMRAEEPASCRRAQRLAEAGENVKTRFSETFANTAEAIDTSGMFSRTNT